MAQPVENPIPEASNCDLTEEKREAPLENVLGTYEKCDSDKSAAVSDGQSPEPKKDNITTPLPAQKTLTDIEREELLERLGRTVRDLEKDLQTLTVKSSDVENMIERNNRTGQVIIKNKSSASLCNLLVYNTDSSTEEDEEGDDDNLSALDNTIYTVESASSSDSESETEELSAIDSSSSDEEQSDAPQHSTGAKQKEVKQSPHPLGDISIVELPPVPDYSNMKIDEKDCVYMGNVGDTINELVLVNSLPGMPAYDIDTLLFLDRGKKALGQIFDVIGPVASPLYVVRFNNPDMIQANNIQKGAPVYCAPNTEHTQYVFVKQLMELRGSDASWVGDVEVPAEFQDYSDDEQESRGKLGLKGASRKRNSLERHKVFEHEMNKKNNMESARLNVPVPNKRPMVDLDQFGLPEIPGFNPRIPPPNFAPVHIEPPSLNFPANMPSDQLVAYMSQFLGHLHH